MLNLGYPCRSLIQSHTVIKAWCYLCVSKLFQGPRLANLCKFAIGVFACDQPRWQEQGKARRRQLTQIKRRHMCIFSCCCTHIYCNFVIVITRATVMQRIDHYTTVHSIWRRNSFRLHLCSATTIEAYASRLCDGHPRQHICLEDQIHRTNSTHCSKYSIVQLSAPCKSCKSKGTYNNDFSKSCNT